MRKSVAVRGRAKLAALLYNLLHRSAQGNEGKQPDPRNMRTWRQFVLGVIVQRSTRLIRVAQAVAPWRSVGSVKSAAMALGYFPEKAQFPMRPFATGLAEAAVLNRGRGKRGRQMQHIDGFGTQTKTRKKRKKGATGKKGSGQLQKVVTTFQKWRGDQPHHVLGNRILMKHGSSERLHVSRPRNTRVVGARLFHAMAMW